MYIRDEVKIMNRIKSDYDYLESLGFEVVAVALQGSQNYDLDYEDSDIDTKAIVLPTFRNLIMGGSKVSTTLILESNEHIDVKDLRLMTDNFLKQNINFLEFLFTKYIYINPEYADSVQKMIDNRERIAKYDNYRGMNCIVGMMHQKHKALEHPYPATADKIAEFGYDGKQLHHIIRCYEFIRRFSTGVSFENSLKSGCAEKLIRVKKNEEYTLEEARLKANSYLEQGEAIKNNYMSSNSHNIDESVEQLLNDVIFEILSKHITKNLKGGL